MPLDRQFVSVPIGGGVDTRTAADRVQPPKLLDLRNASFRQPGAYQQRYGFARRAPAPTSTKGGIGGIAGIPGARGLVAVSNGLHLVSKIGDRRSLLTSGWAEQDFGSAPTVHDDLLPIGVTYQNIGVAVADVTADATVSGENTYVAVAGTTVTQGVAVYEYDAHGQPTGRSFTSGSATPIKPRLVSMGGTIALLFIDGTSLYCRAFTPGTGTPALQVTVATDVHATVKVYDAEAIGDRIYVAYNTSTANTIKHLVLDVGGGVVVGPVSQATAAAPVAISVAVDAAGPLGGDVAIAWAADAATSLYARVYDASTLTAVAAVKTLDAVLGDDCLNIGAVFVDSQLAAGAHELHVYAEIDAASVDLRTVILRSMTRASGAGALFTTYGHSGLGSKPWSIGRGLSCVTLVHDSDEQRSYHIAAFLTTFSTVFAGQLFLGQAPGSLTHLPRVENLGDDRFLAALRWQPLATSGTYANAVTMDFASPIDYVQAGGSAYLPGAIVWELDGSAAFEADFLLFPEGGAAVGANTGGALDASTSYSYLVFLEHTNVNGERRVSTAADVITATTGGGDDAMALTLNTITACNRAGTLFAIYRKEQGGDLYHRVSSGNPASAAGANGPVFARFADAVANTVSFSDHMSEADLLEQEFAPTTGGVLDNVAPPSCTIIAAGNGRVFLAGFSDANLIRYSKTRETMEPLNFNDSLELVVEHGRGPITALGTYQDSLVIFRETQVYVTGGEGLDNAGASGGFSTPRLLSDDIGCPFPRSVCQIPGALVFQSRKGFYSFGGNGIEYIGADVERLHELECLSAVVVADAHEARFLMSDGTTLVFDYVVGAWNTWSVGGLDARLVDNQHVILSSDDGVLLVEAPGTYLDDGQPYSLAIEWPELHAGGLQGAQRVYRILFAGQYLGEHNAFVKLAYDRGPFAEQRTWDPQQVIGVDAARYGAGAYGAGRYGGEVDASTPASTTYQFQVRPGRQKSSSIRVRLEAQARPGGGSLQASYAITDLALEVGVRPGAVRLPAGRTAP